MAWNEPGGNSNNQDPWGGKRRGGDRKGPPDLDEAFRKLQDSLKSWFGGGKRRGSDGRGPDGRGPDESYGGNGGGLWLLGIAVAVLAVFWLYSAIYVVDEQEEAVVLRFGKYYETVKPGLNIYFPPMDRKFLQNVTRERTYTKQGQMLTEDENIVEVPLTVQYKITNLHDYVLNIDQPELSLQHATESALRHVVGSTPMDQVLTEGREVMANDVKKRLQQFLDTYKAGLTVTQVNVQNAAAPHEVQQAFDDVIRAREDEQRARNQAETYANGVIPEARGQAQSIIEDANGYRDVVVSRAKGEADRFSKLVAEYHKAPEITRERLYLETMQEVFSNTSKILVSGEKGQNSMLYLPLDKILESNRSGGASAPSSGTNNATPATPAASTGPATTAVPSADVNNSRTGNQGRDTRSRESR